MGERGYGLIETMRVREGRIPLWSRHLARLERSLRELDLSTPSQDLVALVTPFAGTGDAVLRLEVRDGRASVTVRASPALEPPAVIAASEPHQPYRHKTTERDCFVDAAAEAERGPLPPPATPPRGPPRQRRPSRIVTRPPSATASSTRPPRPSGPK